MRRIPIRRHYKYHRNLIDIAVAETNIILVRKESSPHMLKEPISKWHISKFSRDVTNNYRYPLVFEMAQIDSYLKVSIYFNSDYAYNWVNRIVEFNKLKHEVAILADYSKNKTLYSVTLQSKSYNDFSNDIIHQTRNALLKYDSLCNTMHQHCFRLLTKYSDKSLISKNSELQQELRRQLIVAGVNSDNLSNTHPVWDQILKIRENSAASCLFNRLAFWLLLTLNYDLYFFHFFSRN